MPGRGKAVGAKTGFIALGLTLFLTSHAHAANTDIETGLKACGAIADPTSRLTCADLLIGKYNFAPSPAASKGSWEVKTTRSPVDDSPTVSASNAAFHVTNTGMGSPNVALIIRCQEKSVVSYVVTSGFFGMSRGTLTVLIRIGETPAKSEKWEPSDDGKAVGLWSTNRAVTFAKELASTTRLLTRVTSFNGEQTTAQFDVTGVGSALDAVLQACSPPPGLLSKPAAKPHT